MHKLSENYKVLEFITLQDITSATTTNGTGIDAIGQNDDMVAIVQLGTMTGTHTCNVKMQESESLASGYADIDGATFDETDEDDDDSIAAIGFKRTKRFVRMVVVTAGTVTANEIVGSGLILAGEGKSDLNSSIAA